MPDISHKANHICRWCWRKLIVAIALLVIFLALLFSIIRFTLPFVSDWKTELETVASERLGYQLTIENINVSWKKLYPRVHLVNVAVNQDDKRLFFAGELIAAVDIIRTLINLDIKLHKVTIVDTRIDVIRDKNNQWYINKQRLDQNTSQSKNIQIPTKLQGIILTALNSQLHFKDEIENKEHFFDGLSASATNRSNRYQLFLSSKIPSVLGRRFDIGFDVKGDLNQLADLKGRAYINLDEIDVKQLLPWVANKQPLESGIVSGQFWFDIGDDKQDIFAQLQAEKIKINTEKIQDKAFSTMQTEFDRLQVVGLFKKKENNYQAYLPLVEFIDEDSEQSAVFSDNLLLSITTASTELSRVERFRVSYDQVSLETMRKIISLMPVSKFKTQLEQTRLLGFIKDGFIDCRRIDNNVDCAGTSYFDKVDYSGGEGKPAIAGFSGKVIYRDNQLYASHDSDNLTVDLPDIFIKPLNLTSLRALSWIDIKNGHYRIREGQALASKAKLKFAMDVDIRKQDGVLDKENSAIRLLAEGKNIVATEVSQYLPLKKMHPNLKKWLQAAFKGGVATSGTAVIDSSFSAQKNRARHVWQIEAKGHEIDLKFDPNWPVVDNITGRFLINNKGLFMHTKEAAVLGMPISHAYIWLDDFRQSVLHVDLAGAGELSSLIKLVQQSPLSKAYGNVLDNMSFTGEQTTAVSLQLPFSDVKALSIDAEVALKNSTLHEKVLDLRVKDIPKDTRLYISEAAFASDPFTATLNNHDAGFAVYSSINSDNDMAYTHIEAKTRLPVKAFWPDHAVNIPGWLNSISGMSDYSLGLRLPVNAKSVAKSRKLSINEKYPLVTISSNLLDTESQLPLPLNKSSTSRKNIDVAISLLPENKINTRFSLAESTHGVIDTFFDQGGLKVDSAYIFINQKIQPVANKNKGIHVQGDLQLLNMDRWLEYIDQHTVSNNKNSILDSLHSVNVDIDSFYYLARHLIDLKASVKQQPDRWLIGLDNTAMKGEVLLPKKNIIENGVSARFDYLNMNKISSVTESKTVVDPKSVPHLQIGMGRFEIHDYVFDNVELQTSRISHGIKIDSVIINNPSLLIDMQGEWINLPDGGSETRIAGKLFTENLGDGLQSVGYAKLIKDGYGDIDFSFKWPDSPADIAVSTITGEAQGVFEKGEVLSVDPGGAGRLFSLISLNQLPKRLLFNFKDVDSTGYYFRKMSGDFRFQDGIATTDNFRMRSSIGKVYIEGDADMVKKTYDQKLRFLPDLSATLPVVGTLIGGGATGVGLLVIDGVARLFGKQLDNIGEKKYTITGTWDEPVIESVLKKSSANNVKNQIEPDSKIEPELDSKSDAVTDTP